MKHEDIIGLKFGYLTIIEQLEYVKKNRYVMCICECGNQSRVQYHALKRGCVKSCGCKRKELNFQNSVKYNEITRMSKLYNAWLSMKDRCYNNKNVHYESYGGRGISICDEWINDYANFKDWSIQNGYSKGLSLDRADNDLGYSPNNCRWTDRITQANNTRKNRYIKDINGDEITIAQAARKHGICVKTLIARVNRNVPMELLFSKNKITL